MARIGGVKVSDGGRVYWGVLISVLVGAPVYAYYQGVIWTLQEWTAGVLAAVQGVENTASRFTWTLFAGIAGALESAQTSFIRSLTGFAGTTVAVNVPPGIARGIGLSTATGAPVRVNLGVFTFLVAVVVAVLSMYALLKGVRMARGGLVG